MDSNDLENSFANLDEAEANIDSVLRRLHKSSSEYIDGMKRVDAIKHLEQIKTELDVARLRLHAKETELNQD